MDQVSRETSNKLSGYYIIGNMTDESYAQFAPFSAINDFMLADFRIKVIQRVYANFPSLPDAVKQQVDALTRALVVVPGFRNSAKAPSQLKSRNSVKSFETSSEFVAVILSAWSYTLPELNAQVHSMLAGLGWEVLPIDVDRTKMPGFIPSWPDDQNFSTLCSLFSSQNPKSQITDDEVSLMIVWVALRLPYDQASLDEDPG
jgi:hypothetical protein